MKKMKNALLLTATLALVGLLTSCKAPAAPTSAVTCNKCHTIWFKSPSVSAAAGDKGIVTLKSAAAMSCPDCENKVVAILKTGSLTKHTCPSCGGTLTHCTSH